MSKLEKFDKNMAVDAVVSHDESLFYPDCFAPPFRLSGFPWYKETGKLHRLPEEIAQNVSEGVAYLATETAGGAVSFRTDSDSLYLEAEVTEAALSPKFAPCGRSGFDVYMRRDNAAKLVYVNTVLPEAGARKMQLNIPSIKALLLEGNSPIVEVRIHFPPYDGVRSLQLGLSKGAAVLPPAPYALKKPVVFYGSSITQGACASHPGNAYTNLVCRRLNVDLVNLGFSGSAKGEPLMAETIAKMDMAAFVMDYDHNAPNIAHLEKTHEAFFKIIRAAQPELPIILLSRPATLPLSITAPRKQIIQNTYNNAVAAGDKKVWFIDGEALMGDTDRDACTVDRVHPNDIGFLRMADGVTPVLRQALGL